MPPTKFPNEVEGFPLSPISSTPITNLGINARQYKVVRIFDPQVFHETLLNWVQDNKENIKWKNKSYDFLTHNCQHFKEMIKTRYQRHYKEHFPKTTKTTPASSAETQQKDLAIDKTTKTLNILYSAKQAALAINRFTQEVTVIILPDQILYQIKYRHSIHPTFIQQPLEEPGEQLTLPQEQLIPLVFTGKDEIKTLANKLLSIDHHTVRNMCESDSPFLHFHQFITSQNTPSPTSSTPSPHSSSPEPSPPIHTKTPSSLSPFFHAPQFKKPQKRKAHLYSA